MHRYIIPLAVLSGILLSNCTHPAADLKADVSADRAAEKVTGGEPLSAQAKTQDRSGDRSERTGTMTPTTDNTSSTYWVKAVGTLVYNGDRQFVRSLRFQPKVTILIQVDGWGLIDATKDEWVSMSDLTEQKPDSVLAGPEDSTGLPRINIDVLIPDDQ